MSTAGRSAKLRPAFPRRPLDSSNADPAELSAMEATEVVRLVRKVQTDFDPQSDPRGWDSVAVLVRGVGYTGEEVVAMEYPQLLAVFRTSVGEMRLRKTGSLNHGIATATASIVLLGSADKPPKNHPRKSCKEVLQEWWVDPTNQQRILEAGSAEKIGSLIGFSASSVKESGSIWRKISERLEFRRVELRNLTEMRRADEERLGG